MPLFLLMKHVWRKLVTKKATGTIVIIILFPQYSDIIVSVVFRRIFFSPKFENENLAEKFLDYLSFLSFVSGSYRKQLQQLQKHDETGVLCELNNCR
jgi:protoheme ferro-lyase